MKVYSYEGKKIEDLKEKIKKDLNVEEDNLIIKIKEEDGGLFKLKKIKIEVILKDEVIDYIKKIIKEITKQMGLNVNVECKKRNKYISINLFSNNNGILIGKGGRTIEALQTIIKASVTNKTGFFVNIILDVEDYKNKQNKNLEMLAEKIANEVKETGLEVKLDSMNSYERRIVHEVLANRDDIYTISEGEEPNRRVVIKIKKTSS